ncbi:DUF1906 domain-containing protein [Dactylosporangium sp. CA-092794]|uniref:DUF1906 domain-containing protein n=1 Tax=Dactylosporangium sp. CA-092794 TaxID=3239929 RepID=UPI003D8F45D0
MTSAAIAAAAALIAAASSPAQGSSGISQRRGWDACGIGSSGNAQAFWSNTPYWNMGLYLGGSSYGTGCTQWTRTGVANLRSEGWKLLPIWVGPQAPCSGFPSRFSTDPSTAYSQGFTEASKAYNRLIELGLDVSGTPVIYDLEGFDTSNSACVNAVKQFVSGWVADLHLAPAQKAGVYGSACSSSLSTFRSLPNPPDFIDAAQWDDNPSTAALSPCIPAAAWSNRQRHKQYRGDHNETWNGVTLNVDNDCSDGPVYPSPDELDNGQGCV